MANRDLLAIGTSAGGVDALRFVAKGLAADLPASVLITIHLSSRFLPTLDEILTWSGPLPARFAGDGELLQLSCHSIPDNDNRKLLRLFEVRAGLLRHQNHTHSQS